MTISKGTKRFELAPFVIAICVFCILQPYFMWNASNMIKFGVIPSLYLLAIIPNMDLKKGNVLYFAVFASLLMFLILLQGYSFAYSISILSLSVVPFIKDNVFNTSLRYFEIILALFFAGGLIFHIALLFGMPIEGQYIAPLNEEKIMGYSLYFPFMVRANSLLDFFRFFGPFDEPGVVGTVSLFVLFIEKYNLKKWYLAVIFTAAIFSFSFFFIVASFIFLLYRISKKPSTFIISALAILIFFGITKNIPVIDELVYSRFEIEEDSGMLAGDNRSSEAQRDYFNSIRGTSDYFLGTHGKTEGEFVGQRSYIDAIFSYGFIFCFLYFVWMFLYAQHRKMDLRDTIVILLVLLGNFYQRPNLIHFSYLFLYAAFIVRWSHDSRILQETVKDQ